MKTVTKADLYNILKLTNRRRLYYRSNPIYDKLLTLIAPYAEKGISNVEEELDFCGSMEELLDSKGKLDADGRVTVVNAIYDALEFPHFWKG